MPETDCSRRRNAMAKLQKLEVLHEGYKKFLTYQKLIEDESGFAAETMRSLKATEEERDFLESELRTMPPWTNSDCPDHSTLEPKINDNFKINDNDKKKKTQKRKNSKNNSDDFVFPSKTTRPTTPTPVLQPLDTQNSFANLEQKPEPFQNQTTEISTPKPHPCFLKNQ
ncbi:hypothetical protein TNCV_219771 [Trichonephila clavipes]|nr:hypothetical protein TNCV_219771 [Trichonephila clavipes]